jgi:hypothetical protein
MNLEIAFQLFLTLPYNRMHCRFPELDIPGTELIGAMPFRQLVI